MANGIRIGEEFNPVLRAFWTIDLMTDDDPGVLTIGKHMSSFFCGVIGTYEMIAGPTGDVQDRNSKIFSISSEF